ncbi:MAG: hypothetical protein IKE75_03030 [Bacilli bacterium]|nr:hypothetical protein [Bacilli bacterium]
MEMVNLLDVTCGTITIPQGIANVVHLIVFLIQVVVPILLIIWGMIDFAKSVVGGDEDKVKAGQKIFIKRLIAAVLVFLIVTITQLLISVVASVGGTGNDANSAWTCARSLITGR